MRIRQRLYRVIIHEATRHPFKSLIECPRIFAHRSLVIDMKRRRHLGRNRFELCFRERKGLVGHGRSRRRHPARRYLSTPDVVVCAASFPSGRAPCGGISDRSSGKDQLIAPSHFREVEPSKARLLCLPRGSKRNENPIALEKGQRRRLLAFVCLDGHRSIGGICHGVQKSLH